MRRLVIGVMGETGALSPLCLLDISLRLSLFGYKYLNVLGGLNTNSCR